MSLHAVSGGLVDRSLEIEGSSVTRQPTLHWQLPILTAGSALPQPTAIRIGDIIVLNDSPLRGVDATVRI